MSATMKELLQNVFSMRPEPRLYRDGKRGKSEIGRSAKLLLAFASTVIPGFRLLEIS
jgi:hypothetical protein